MQLASGVHKRIIAAALYLVVIRPIPLELPEQLEQALLAPASNKFL
jgi:hypothetical protein